MLLYREINAMSVLLEEKDEDELQGLIASISHSKALSSSKSTHAWWTRYFDVREVRAE